MMMANNPDHYTKRTRVRLSPKGKRQEIARAGAIGVVTSRWPVFQVVTVQWDHKKSRDRIHVDLLEPTDRLTLQQGETNERR
jgi:hypothetical protein